MHRCSVICATDSEHSRTFKRIEQEFDSVVERPAKLPANSFPTGSVPAIMHCYHWNPNDDPIEDCLRNHSMFSFRKNFFTGWSLIFLPAQIDMTKTSSISGISLA